MLTFPMLTQIRAFNIGNFQITILSYILPQNSSSKYDISTIIKYIILKISGIFLYFTRTVVADKILFLNDTHDVM